VPRSFIALVLDEASRHSVAAQVEGLRPLSRAVAWVPPQNLHLTLKFLGEQSEERLGVVRSVLEAAAAGIAPFALTLHGVGGFPGLDRPRILWVGVSEGALAVRQLQPRVEEGLARHGFSRETRSWHPHLTIGRVFDDRRWRREGTPALREAVARAARLDLGRVPVAAIWLMRSDLSPAGARHTALASMPLRPDGSGATGAGAPSDGQS
jgi:2'-5' RNA ligase